VSFQKVRKILEEYDAKNVTLLCHHNADPDAICSAYAFKSLLRHFNPQLNVEIGAAQGISRLSKRILKQLSIEVETQPKVEKSNAIVLLDTNTIQQLNDTAGKVKASRAPIIVIDHHAFHPETEKLSTLYIVDENASSTSEIIYRFFKQADVKLGENEAKALFLGIAYDTRHFSIANSSTFKAIAELIDAGVDAKETLSMLSLPMYFSERMARLKGAKRIKTTNIRNWVVASSHVNAYQASTARAIIELGAHVAIVAGHRKEKLEISLRSSNEFHKKTGVHLGRDVAKKLGEQLHGMGGGHPTAAGVNGEGDIETGLDYCLLLLKGTLTNG